jgi:hypothetical protein
MLPSWSARERFNHFYRVAINTRPEGDQGGKTLRVGDRLEILDDPVAQCQTADGTVAIGC